MKSINCIIPSDSISLFWTSLRNRLEYFPGRSLFNDNCRRKDALHTLKKYFQSEKLPRTPEQIYGLVHSLFVERYGVANLIKNYYCITELYQMGLLRSRSKILDLGCGPGAFEFAYLFWLKNHSDFLHQIADITIVDAVKEFLDLFQVIWSGIKFELKQNIFLREQIRFVDGRLEHIAPSPDIIVFSSSLSEMLRDPRVNNKRLSKSLIDSNAIILFIDYGYDALRPILTDFLSDLMPHYETAKCFAGETWDKYFDQIDLGYVRWGEREEKPASRKANVQFIKAILIPKTRKDSVRASDAVNVVYKYKQTWEYHDINLLQTLFSEDAIYHERCDHRPFDGLQEICNYWKKNAEQQRKVIFEPLYIDTIKEDRINTLWRCRFYRQDINRWMSLLGIFEAQIRQGKIFQFKEKFRKTIGDEPLW